MSTNKSTKWARLPVFLVSFAICTASATLSGCQPEGVGTMKPPEGKRPSDSSLGRPFGNAPEIPKKAAKKGPDVEEQNKGLQNPRL